MLSDVVRAYNTIKQHHNNIILCGDSAGGHLAARARGILPTARILFGAPLVFDRNDPTILKQLKGKADRFPPVDFDARAECNGRYVASAFKNTSILHGSADKIVPHRHAEVFYDFLKQHGTANSTLRIYPQQPHEFQFRKMKDVMIDYVVNTVEGLKNGTE
jgi:acetyl esterase/lipase